MSAISAIALSGIQLARRQLDAGAHNIANASTEGFRRQVVLPQAQAGGGVAGAVVRAPAETPGLAVEDLVGLTRARHGFEANIKSLAAGHAMLGTLLDTFA
ncbi:MAG: flagellar basal body protein [Rehaibacterium terrae]|uniref:flagellar basal body protein n=1 Tax=Rehaibacterium terrae TaxID=1341696 RepID=UPI00391A1A44